MRQSVYFLVVSLVLGLNFSCEFDGEKTLTQQQINVDIDYLFTTLEECHPNLYMQYDSLVFSELKNKLKEKSSSITTLLDFEYELLKLSHFLDGHTNVYPEHFVKQIDRREILPLFLFGDEHVILGTDTLISINSIPSSQLVSCLDSLVSWEYHPYRRNDLMNSYLNQLLQNKYRFTYPYEVVFLRENAGYDTIASDHINQRKNTIFYNQAGKSFHYQKMYDKLIFEEQKIAVFFHNTCGFYEKKDIQEYEIYVDSFFDEIVKKDIQYLFIDVSQNGGGLSAVNDLFLKHLNRVEHRYEVKREGQRKGIQKMYHSYKKIFKELNLIDEFEDSLLHKGHVTRVIEETSQTGYFKGTVFTIMGYNTYSSGRNFCESIKRYNNAVLVGQEVGQRAPFCGNVLDDQLPNSKLKFRYPTTYSYITPSLNLKDGFLQPDIYYDIKPESRLENLLDIIKIAGL